MSARLLSGVAIFFGVFFALYVGYAHVSSWRMLARAPASWSTRFDGPSVESEGLRVEHDGLAASIVGGDLQMGGPTARPGFVRAVRPRVRFESGRFSVRFRVAERASYDVMVGFQTPDDPARRIAFAFVNDQGAPRLRLLGVGSPIGPPSAGDGILDELDGVANIAADFEPNRPHELGLRFDAIRQRLEMFVDGVVVGSRATGWMAGFDVEPFFGVEERSAGSNPHVVVESASFEPGPSGPPPRGTEFVDEFWGGTPDFLHWHAEIPNGWHSQGGIVPIASGAGLHLRGGATIKTTPELQSPVELCLYPFELGPVLIKTAWDIRALRYGMFYVLIENINDSREFEAAVHATDDEHRSWLFSGHANDDLNTSREEGSALGGDGDVSFEVSYDPWFRTATVRSKGQVIHRKRYDLRRDEFVRICVGGRVSAGGEFDGVLKRFELHAAPY